LFLSHGTPMLTMGDEIGHTRQGNNNPWNQANALNWLDWEQAAAQPDLLAFVQGLIRFTQQRPILQEDRFWKATSHEIQGDISWHGLKPAKPDWSDQSHVLAWTLHDPAGREEIHVLLNASDKEKVFMLPDLHQGWHRLLVVETSAGPGEDIHPGGKPADPKPKSRKLPTRSACVFWDRPV